MDRPKVHSQGSHSGSSHKKHPPSSSSRSRSDNNNNNNNNGSAGAKHQSDNNASSANSAQANANKGSISAEYLCKVKYYNNLPEVPFDPKLLNYPFNDLRFVQYGITSLEKNYKHALHTEPNLGVQIDLIDPTSYTIPAKVPALAAEDRALLEPSSVESTAKAETKPKTRVESIRPTVSWLKKTIYIGENSDVAKPKYEQLERQAGWARKKKEGEGVKTDEQIRQDQIGMIERSFDSAKDAPQHPHKPNLKPVEVLPIFPNADLWPNTYLQVVFDRDPVPQLPEFSNEDEANQAKSEAILKNFKTEHSTFVAYLVPKKRKRDEPAPSADSEVYNKEEYQWVREYQYEVKTGREFTDTYFFMQVPGEETFTYNEVSTRVTLSKLKIQKSSEFLQPSKVIAVHRHLNAEEKDQREAKLNALLQPETYNQMFGGGLNGSQNREEDGDEKLLEEED